MENIENMVKLENESGKKCRNEKNCFCNAVEKVVAFLRHKNTSVEKTGSFSRRKNTSVEKTATFLM
ncbi:MAG: hypothetical protein IJF40_05585 [Clostridia bacterium]|nr:hypothetical protein [Clostridia bacterium]